MKIAVSILKSNYSEEETINKVNKTNAEYIHLDIMDGNFVIQKTPDYNYLHNSKKRLQVHLMVSKPKEYIDKYNLPNVDSIIIQTEIKEDIKSHLEYIKRARKRAGLALNPETSINALLPYIDMLDDILVLTVHPGLGGQKMLVDITNKIDELIKIRDEKGLNFEITVDGGVNDETISLVRNADISVVGSFICTSDNFNTQIQKLYYNLD